MGTKGDRLRAIRDALSYDQAAMAAALKIDQGTLSRMERNKSGFSEKTIECLAGLEVNINWFLTGDGEMFLLKESKPDETSNLLNEMSNQVRVMRDDMDKIENTIKKLMGRK